MSNWNEKCFHGGTCPTCRYAWDKVVIANNKSDWEAKKRQKVDAPAELPADQEGYDAERAKKREEAWRMRKINKESTNMFVNGVAGWNILFKMHQHDGKDDDRVKNSSR